MECRDKTLYCGVTININRRVDEHNYSKKGAKYTKPRLPVRLMWSEECKSKSEAYSLEAKIKKLTRTKKMQLIASNNLSLFT